MHVLQFIIYLYNTNSVCLSVKYRRPNYRTDHDQIWHAYADRPGDGSYQKKFDPPPKGPRLKRKTQNLTQNKRQTYRAKQYKVTSFLSTDCELSINPCSKNVYNLGPRGVEVGVLGGSKNQKSGKCHELSRKSIIFVLTHVPGVLGVKISKVREISRTAEKIDTKKLLEPLPHPIRRGAGGGGGLRAKISK